MSTELRPLNKNIFQEHEFMPSNVTDRPLPIYENEPRQETILEQPHCDEELLPSSSGDSTQKYNQLLETSSQENSNIVTPSMIRPHPKAEAQKEVRRGRHKCKSRILIDTPEKNEIEGKEAARQNKKPKINKTEKVQKLRVKKKILKEESETSGEENGNFSVQLSDASEGFLSFEDEPLCNYFQTNKENIHTTNYKDDDYVILIYEREYFVGKIMSINAESALIKSMKKSLKNGKWPEK
ncbi:hypothetical protein HHI36_007099 [Cryptolaemus montrouzieri]|uniref:Uncharacterized protein n=1 Tax=Cryptolaemus montrouzieri TaxID=559131 RepID=A0ABD2MNN9_9CUCU